MFCIPISDETYRRAARLVGVEEIHLAPVEDPEFAELRARVDAIILECLRDGLQKRERGFIEA